LPHFFSFFSFLAIGAQKAPYPGAKKRKETQETERCRQKRVFLHVFPNFYEKKQSLADKQGSCSVFFPIFIFLLFSSLFYCFLPFSIFSCLLLFSIIFNIFLLFAHFYIIFPNNLLYSPVFLHIQLFSSIFPRHFSLILQQSCRNNRKNA